MICSKCGKEVANDAKFCLFCGQPMGAAAVAPQPVPGFPQPAQQYAPQPQAYQQPIPQPAPQYQQPAPQYQQPVSGFPQPVGQYVPQPQYSQPVQNYQAQPYGAPVAPVPAQYNPAGFAPVGQKPKRFDIKKPDTIIILASCIMLLISLFLKYYGLNKKRTTVSVATSLIKVTTGWPYLINIVLCLLFLFLGLKVGVFVMSILNTVWMILVVVINENVIKENDMTKVITRGPGFYISIISSVVLLIGGIMILVRRNKEKSAISAPHYAIPTM